MTSEYLALADELAKRLSRDHRAKLRDRYLKMAERHYYAYDAARSRLDKSFLGRGYEEALTETARELAQFIGCNRLAEAIMNEGERLYQEEQVALARFDGTSGQDRDNYSDDQDRESYQA